MKQQPDPRVSAYLKSLTFWDNAPLAFGVTQQGANDKATWRYANPALCALLGRGGGTLVGLCVTDLLPETGAHWAQLMNETAAHEKAQYLTQYSPQLEKTLHIKMYCPLAGVAACVLWDMTEYTQQAQQSALAQNRLELILHHTTDAVFDFDLETRTLYNGTNLLARRSTMPVLAGVPQSLLARGQIRAAGEQAIEHALSLMEGGASDCVFYVQFRFREDEAMAWYLVKLLRAPETDLSGTHTRLLGYLRNVDTQHRQQEALRTAAERDGLTELFNRSAAKRRCDLLLRNKGRFAFFVFDIDNFKLTNDTFGHSQGDMALQRFAEVLRHSFRQDELIWRQGGDEFCACIFGELSPTMLQSRCGTVLRSYARSAGAGENANGPTPQCAGADAPAAKPHIPSSCSIGVAYGTCPHSFTACFAAADAALLETKRSGKNGFTLVPMEAPCQEPEVTAVSAMAQY